MAEVSVALTLGKQSGTLAAAIASLRRMDLEFKSHRLAELNGSGLRELTLLAAGEVADPGRLASELLAVRGVEDVAQIQIDGQPINVSAASATAGQVPVPPAAAAVTGDQDSARPSADDPRLMRPADLEAFSVPAAGHDAIVRDEPIPGDPPDRSASRQPSGDDVHSDPQAVSHSRMRRRRRRG